MTNKMSCRFCRGDRLHERFDATDINRAVDDCLFHYVQCEDCTTLQIVNVPEDIGRYYGGDYYPPPASASALLAASKHDHYKVELIQKHVPEGKLLEIGPGTGGFAYLAKLAGFHVNVIEMDAACSAFIQDVLEITVLPIPENQISAETTSQRYDVVALWHVLEHLPEPGPVLDNLSQIIVPGGIIVLALPDPNSIQFRLFGKYWVHLDAPRHLTLIHSQSLTQALQKRGFEIQEETRHDHGTRFWNRFGWIESARNLPLHPALKPLAVLFAYGLAFLSFGLGRADPSNSAYTLIAKRTAA